MLHGRDGVGSPVKDTIRSCMVDNKYQNMYRPKAVQLAIDEIKQTEDLTNTDLLLQSQKPDSEKVYSSKLWFC